MNDKKYGQIGIITGKKTKYDDDEILGNGSLISCSIGLTNLNTIAYIKDYELHLYIGLVFYPYPYGGYKKNGGFKISNVRYPKQKFSPNLEKDF